MTTATPHTPDAMRASQPSSLLERRTIGLAIIVVALLITIWLSFAVGANKMPMPEVWEGFRAHDDSEAAIIIWSLRIPRTVAGLLVGAAYGVAGALIKR